VTTAVQRQGTVPEGTRRRLVVGEKQGFRQELAEQDLVHANDVWGLEDREAEVCMASIAPGVPIAREREREE